MIRFALAAVVALIVDQLTKALVLTNMRPSQEIVVIPHALSWTYVQNHHAAFGLGNASPAVMIGLAIAVVAIFVFTFRRALAHSLLVQLALGAIVGGAIGNMVDRLRFGFVVDFIDVKVWTETFNSADTAITLGAFALALSLLLRERRAAQTAF